jgi:hypothetical protein
LIVGRRITFEGLPKHRPRFIDAFLSKKLPISGYLTPGPTPLELEAPSTYMPAAAPASGSSGIAVASKHMPPSAATSTAALARGSGPFCDLANFGWPGSRCQCQDQGDGIIDGIRMTRRRASASSWAVAGLPLRFKFAPHFSVRVATETVQDTVGGRKIARLQLEPACQSGTAGPVTVWVPHAHPARPARRLESGPRAGCPS